MGCLRETGHQEAGITYQLASWFTDDTWNRSAKPRIIENFPIDVHETESLEAEPLEIGRSRDWREFVSELNGGKDEKLRKLLRDYVDVIRTKRRGSVSFGGRRGLGRIIKNVHNNRGSEEQRRAITWALI